jgi:Zn-dependent protease/CBS domain-containing protein
MAWSWRIGRVAGIPIFVHWTFLILIAWLLIGSIAEGHGLWKALAGVASVLALFACVVLHELGHALAARRFGIPTTDITLLPIGGVARMARIPERPVQELVVALAGPAVNVVIAVTLLLGGVRAPFKPVGSFGPWLLQVNLMLAAFNLVPAFPMDGGRVLRALLAMRMDYPRATRLAASIGQSLAIGFGLLGLSSTQPLFLLVALFVWIGAEAEASQVEERAALQGVTVRAAMFTEFHQLGPDDTLGRAVDLLLASPQHDFPVVEAGRLTGVLTRADLLSGLARGGPSARVGESARTEFTSVEADDKLVPALTRLRESGGPCLPVVEQGRPVGLLTLEHIGEFLMVRTALAVAPRPSGRPLTEDATAA